MKSANTERGERYGGWRCNEWGYVLLMGWEALAWFESRVAIIQCWCMPYSTPDAHSCTPTSIPDSVCGIVVEPQVRLSWLKSGALMMTHVEYRVVRRSESRIDRGDQEAIRGSEEPHARVCNLEVTAGLSRGAVIAAVAFPNRSYD